MSEENLDLIKLIFADGVDLVPLMEDDERLAETERRIAPLLDPEFELVMVAQDVAASYPGLDGWQAAWSDWMESWESWVVRAERFIDLGDKVVVLWTATARSGTEGVEMQPQGADVFSFREGRILRFETGPTRDAVLKHAGVELPQGLG